MRAAGTVALVLLLAGCGAGTPADELRARVDDVTVAANARDADALRGAAQSLADTASAQRDEGTLDETEAERILALAAELEAGADVVDPDVRARQEAEQRAREAAAEAEAAEAARAEAEARAEEAAREAERAREQGRADERDEKAEKEAEKEAEEAAEKAQKEAEKQAEEAAEEAEEDGD